MHLNRFLLYLFKKNKKIHSIVLAISMHLLLAIFFTYTKVKNTTPQNIQVDILDNHLMNFVDNTVFVPKPFFKNPTYADTHPVKKNKAQSIKSISNTQQISKISTLPSQAILKKIKKNTKNISDNVKKKHIVPNKIIKYITGTQQLQQLKIRNLEYMNHEARQDNVYKLHQESDHTDYINMLIKKIRSNTTFYTLKHLKNNPAVKYIVKLFPNGSIRHIKNIHPSSLPDFDEAVKQAIKKSQPFPPDINGKVPPQFIFVYTLKNLKE